MESLRPRRRLPVNRIVYDDDTGKRKRRRKAPRDAPNKISNTWLPLLSSRCVQLLLATIACWNATILVSGGWDLGAAHILRCLVPFQLVVLCLMCNAPYMLHLQLLMLVILLDFKVGNTLEGTNFRGMELLLEPFFATDIKKVWPQIWRIWTNPWFLVSVVTIGVFLLLATVLLITKLALSFHGSWMLGSKCYLIVCMAFAMWVCMDSNHQTKYRDDGLVEDYRPPRHLGMRSKPSIALIAADADIISSLEPLSLFANAPYCTELKQHDSGAFTPEQGFASLLYGIHGPSQEDFRVFRHNTYIQSWPLSLLRGNGYHTHRVTSQWADEDGLDLTSEIQERGFTTTHGSDDEVQPLQHALDWVRATGNNEPFFLSVDVPARGSAEDIVQLRELTNEIHSAEQALTIFTSYHAGNSRSDSFDTQVPLVLCGDQDIVNRASSAARGNGVTAHASVLSSVLTACRAFLGGEWHVLGDGQHRSFSYAQHPVWSDFDVLHLEEGSYLVRDGDEARIVNSTIADEVEEHKDTFVDLMNRIRDGCRWPGSTRPSRTRYHSTLPNLNISDTPSRQGHALSATLISMKTATAYPVVDVLSIGAISRTATTEMQMKTWASSDLVREFRGVTEMNDYNASCSKMSEEDTNNHIAMCRDHDGWGMLVRNLITLGFTRTEIGFRKDTGWLCAQRRIASLFQWMHQYDDERLPDFLVSVDDDTYFDVDLLTAVEKDSGVVRAGCLLPSTELFPWNYPYGGFGVAYPKRVVQLLKQPIYCRNETTDAQTELSCRSIKRNIVGERPLFAEGMSIAQLFQDYVSSSSNCMHSDWLVGYIIKTYLNQTLDGFSQFPLTCSNASHACEPGLATCHRVDAAAMKSQYQGRELLKRNNFVGTLY